MKCSEISHRRWLAVLGLVTALALGSAIWQGVVGQESSRTGTSSDLAEAEGLSRAFRSAAKAVIPTVVKIISTTNAQVPENRPGETPQRNPFEGTPFEDFFGDNFPGFDFQFEVPPRRGLGSGVIIDPAGIILTNNHVVEGADKVTVELADGGTFEATQIKTDELSDLAVLRIKADKPLPAATLGDSDNLQIGDWVLAIGNPFEMDHTVSAGIISGTGRSLRGALPKGERTDFLQTDATINPGNSGGPLVNLRGEVVGISTAIASRTGLSQGVGFAIPINLAKWVTGQLIESGTVKRAYLGVGIQEATSDLGRRLGADQIKGVLVGSVYRGSPAAEAGLQVGDVIQKFAGRAVTTPRQLQELVERLPADSKQEVQIVRDGRPRTLEVVVKPLPQDLGLAAAPGRGGGGGSAGFVARELGMEVGDLTEAAAKQFGLEGLSGVVVTRVDAQGIAASAGISRGMLIVEVERKPVQSVEEFSAALKDKSVADGILLKTHSGDGEQLFLLQRS
jgi:serine protease Do